MRIGLVAPPWLPVPPPAYGGTEAVVDRLARGLVARGHDVQLIATGDSSCPVPTSWVFERAQAMRMGSVLPEIHQVLYAYEQLEGCDVIHDHTLLGPVLAATAGRGNVVTTHHSPFDADARAAFSAISDRVAVIAISHHHASTAEGVTIAKVILHGLDAERFPIGFGAGGYLLFLGRMAADKGPHRAIRIARAAGLPIILAGRLAEQGELRYFEAKVAPLLGTDATYVGEADEVRKLGLLGDAIALVNPIRWPEPFGLTMIESLACATPVLAFREGAAPELIDDGVTGFLADSEEELIAAARTISSIDRAACRKVAETRFSADRMVDEHLDLYELVRRGER